MAVRGASRWRWVGFVLTVEGRRIYHAGDTDHVPEMASIVTDVVLLPVSGIYVMTAEEAVEAAAVIQLQVAIPMHVGGGIGSLADAEYSRERICARGGPADGKVRGGSL